MKDLFIALRAALVLFSAGLDYRVIARLTQTGKAA